MSDPSRRRYAAGIAATLAIIMSYACCDAAAAAPRKSHSKAKTTKPPGPDVEGELDAAMARLYAGLAGEEEQKRAPATPAAPRKKSSATTIIRSEEPMCRQVDDQPAMPQDCDFGRRLCEAAGIPDGEPVWVLVSVPDPDDPNRRSSDLDGYRCRPPGEDRPATIPVLSQRQLRELPLPAGAAHVQPDSGPLLVNMPTNVYVEAPTVTLRTTLLGQAVEVEATPMRFSWDFGDGETLTTTDPGAPYPDMRTTHTYTTTGTRKITLTTVYTARFRVVGDDEWLPAQGTAQVQSVPIDVELIETRAVLVP